MGSQEMARERFGSEIGKGEKAQGHTMQKPLDRHPGRSLAVNAVPSQMVPPPKKKRLFETVKGKVHNLHSDRNLVKSVHYF